MTKGAKAIRAYREREDVSLAELAARVRVSKATLSRIENGLQPITLDVLPKLSDATRIPPRDLRPDLAELFARAR